jgi:hypothetical protein
MAALCMTRQLPSSNSSTRGSCSVSSRVPTLTRDTGLVCLLNKTEHACTATVSIMQASNDNTKYNIQVQHADTRQQVLCLCHALLMRSCNNRVLKVNWFDLRSELSALH